VKFGKNIYRFTPEKENTSEHDCVFGYMLEYRCVLTRYVYCEINAIVFLVSMFGIKYDGLMLISVWQKSAD
jgi:hypothetical protein